MSEPAWPLIHYADTEGFVRMSTGPDYWTVEAKEPGESGVKIFFPERHDSQAKAESFLTSAGKKVKNQRYTEWFVIRHIPSELIECVRSYGRR